MLDQRCHRIEGNIVIDELAQIRIQSWNTALFSIFSVLDRIKFGRHRLAQYHKGGTAFVIVGSVLGRRQRSEHSPEAALKFRRRRRGHQSAKWLAMRGKQSA